jgi:hypothetical protein
MNHQYYENLLMERENLAPTQKGKLDQHIEECAQCARLDQSLRVVDHELRTAAVIAPPPGFTARWQASLPEKRKKKEQEQKRIIIISMVSSTVAALITVGAFLLPPVSPITILTDLFTDFVQLVNHVTQFWNFVGHFFTAVPTGLSIWIIASTLMWVSLTMLAWGIALFRIARKGIRATI